MDCQTRYKSNDALGSMYGNYFQLFSFVHHAIITPGWVSPASSLLSHKVDTFSKRKCIEIINSQCYFCMGMNVRQQWGMKAAGKLLATGW